MEMTALRISCGICMLGLLSGSAISKESKQQPNVLFIFADDMSFETIGSYGMLDIDTPNLDKLSERGANFTHAYNMGSYSPAVCGARCSPTMESNSCSRQRQRRSRSSCI